MKTAMHSMVERAKRQDCKVRVNGNLTSRKKNKLQKKFTNMYVPCNLNINKSKSACLYLSLLNKISETNIYKCITIIKS